MSQPSRILLSFDGGTLVLTGDAPVLNSLPGVIWDSRTQSHRAEGRSYRPIVETLRQQRIPYLDQARGYPAEPTPWILNTDRQPRDYQCESVETWNREQKRGVIVLPTGTGKTLVAMLAIEGTARPTIVVTPTIDLLNQWHYELGRVFGVPIGALGGGNHEYHPITVTTYDSAHLRLEQWGHRYGLLIFDECHHLPGPTYQQIAIGSIAPFRLGLTATPERADGGEQLFPNLIGPIVYRRDISELKGEYLATYRTMRVYVDLSTEELERYRQVREFWRGFLAQRGISLSGANGWARFLAEANRSRSGWEAFQAYQEQKRIERASAAKLTKLESLLEEHVRDRVLIFTADNATVYQIARRFLLPPITHQTKAKERKQILDRFHQGTYRAIVTSQVLNEGVDVPAANVGIVLSGTGSATENVQRLGRILRKHGDKQATLYEVITRGTAEEYVSDRRRQHDAFR